MEEIIKNNTQSKMCRQCHRTKTLSHFVNKSNTGICIICKTCRENQMRRYYEKKLMIKKENEKITASKRIMRYKDASIQHRCTMSPIVQPNPGLLSSGVSNLEQRTFIDHTRKSVIVPVSKWIVLPKSYTQCSDFFTAKLLYHMSFSHYESSMSTLSSTDSS